MAVGQSKLNTPDTKRWKLPKHVSYCFFVFFSLGSCSVLVELASLAASHSMRIMFWLARMLVQQDWRMLLTACFLGSFLPGLKIGCVTVVDVSSLSVWRQFPSCANCRGYLELTWNFCNRIIIIAYHQIHLYYIVARIYIYIYTHTPWSCIYLSIVCIYMWMCTVTYWCNQTSMGRPCWFPYRRWAMVSFMMVIPTARSHANIYGTLGPICWAGRIRGSRQWRASPPPPSSSSRWLPVAELMQSHWIPGNPKYDACLD